jgi:hypothetical protein
MFAHNEFGLPISSQIMIIITSIMVMLMRGWIAEAREETRVS